MLSFLGVHYIVLHIKMHIYMKDRSNTYLLHGEFSLLLLCRLCLPLSHCHWHRPYLQRHWTARFFKEATQSFPATRRSSWFSSSSVPFNYELRKKWLCYLLPKMSPGRVWSRGFPPWVPRPNTAMSQSHSATSSHCHDATYLRGAPQADHCNDSNHSKNTPGGPPFLPSIESL